MGVSHAHPPPGAYGTHCSDAAPHPNYTFHYVTGVLHVVEAATTLALMSPMVKGSSARLTMMLSGRARRTV